MSPVPTKDMKTPPSSHFWIKLNFWAPKTPLLDTHSAQMRYDVIWHFQHIFSFSTLHIFYVQTATSDGGVEGSAYPQLGNNLDVLEKGVSYYYIEINKFLTLVLLKIKTSSIYNISPWINIHVYSMDPKQNVHVWNNLVKYQWGWKHTKIQMESFSSKACRIFFPINLFVFSYLVIWFG